MTRLCPEGEVVEIWGDGENPSGFVWRGVSHRIADTYSRWRIHTNWWQQGLSVSALSPLTGGTWREYLKVTTDSGLLCLLFRDLEGGREISAEGRGMLAEGQGSLAEGRETPNREGSAWYLARIYD
jgi:hypothetical protein